MSFILRIEMLLQFLKLIYNRAVYWLFPTFTCKQFKLERPSMEKLKFKHLNRVFGMLRFFEVLKICGFAFVKIAYCSYNRDETCKHILL